MTNPLEGHETAAGASVPAGVHVEAKRTSYLSEATVTTQRQEASLMRKGSTRKERKMEGKERGKLI